MILLSLLIIFLLIIGIVCWLYFENQKQFRLVSHLPGPPSHWLLGNIPQFRTLQEKDQVPIWLRWAQSYGLTFRISAPFAPPAVFIADPHDIMHVLKKNFDNYPKGRDLTVIFSDLAGNGIFNTNGPSWQAQRKTASHIFKVRSMRSYFSVFLEHGLALCQILEKHALSAQPFDLQQLLYRYTFDSICAIAFGHQPHTLRDGPSPLLAAFDAAQYMVELRGRNPLFHFTRYTSPSDRRALAFLDAQCLAMIAARREKIRAGEPFDEEDLLALYMRDPAHTDRYLRDAILNFMLAGRDTTGTTLTWALYSVATHPAVERKLLDELSQHGVTAESGEGLDYARMSSKQLTYLRAVIDETLRMYPPVPYDPKTAVCDDTLPSGARIRAGTTVVWSAYITGRTPQFFEDPEAFDPDRWGPERVGRIPGIFCPFDFPFQWGPRLCLGRDLARLEITTLLSLVLPRFQFHPTREAIPGKSITLNALDGIPVIVTKRE